MLRQLVRCRAGGSVKGGAGIGPSMQRMGSSLLMGYSSNPSVR